MKGLIQPIGGHKGVALGMMVGMLSSFLSGTGYGLETGNMVDGPVAGRDGQFFIAIDIAALSRPGRVPRQGDGRHRRGARLRAPRGRRAALRARRD